MPAMPKANAPGAYAQGRYDRGLRNYRRRLAPIVAVVFGPFVLGGVAFLIKDGHAFSWAAGAVTGACVTAWSVLRDEPPAYIANWRQGAEGERRTAKALRPLQRSGLRVFHDVQAGCGNYDHIVVGCSGVFLLETKNLSGVVELDGGVARLKRRLDPEAAGRLERIRPRALSAAASLKEDIEGRTGHRTWVQAVVVFWGDFPQGVVDDGRCVFLHGSRLRDWLRARPERFDQQMAGQIVAAVAQLAGQPAPPVPENLGELRSHSAPLGHSTTSY